MNKYTTPLNIYPVAPLNDLPDEFAYIDQRDGAVKRVTRDQLKEYLIKQAKKQSITSSGYLSILKFINEVV